MSILEKLLGYLKLQRASTAIVVVPKQLVGRWTQARDADTNRVIKYEHTCQCETTRNFEPNEINRQKNRSCTCGEFNLKQALASGAVSTKIVKRAAPARTMQAVGDEPVKVVWSGKPDGALQRAYDSGDPANIPGNMF